MCGRFSETISFDDLLEYFQIAEVPAHWLPRYNIAPSQEIPAIRMEENVRRLGMLHWGLIPFWAKDPNIGNRMINARAETADKLPAFRTAFRQRRCLVVASGFYEWDKTGGSRQPYHIARADQKPMAFAGLWERWEDKVGKGIVESCAILTTDANEEIGRLHNRMPVILDFKDFDLWLDPQEHRISELKALLHPFPNGALHLRPVSRYVNKPSNEGEKCLESPQVSGSRNQDISDTSKK